MIDVQARMRRCHDRKHCGLCLGVSNIAALAHALHGSALLSTPDAGYLTQRAQMNSCFGLRQNCDTGLGLLPCWSPAAAP